MKRRVTVPPWTWDNPRNWIPNFGQRNIVDVPEVQDCHPDDFHLFVVFPMFVHSSIFSKRCSSLPRISRSLPLKLFRTCQRKAGNSPRPAKIIASSDWMSEKLFWTGFLVFALGNTRESIRWIWKQLVLKLEKTTSNIVNADFRIQELDLQNCKENMDFGQSNWRDLFILGDGIACDRVPMWINAKCQFLYINIFLILGSFHLWCDIILPSQMLGFL